METQLLPVLGDTWSGDICLIEEAGRWSWILMTGLANIRSGSYLSFENALESIVASKSAGIFSVPGWKNSKKSLRVYLRDYFLGRVA